MSLSARDRWRPIWVGLAGGIGVVFVSLVGMLAKFKGVWIVEDVLNLAFSLWFAWILLAGARAARGATHGAAALARGAAAGLAAGLLVAAFTWLGTGSGLPLRSVFVNATPQLFAILQLGRGDAGVGLAIVASTLAGGVGAALSQLPERHRSVGVRIIAVLALLGTLQDLVRVVLTRLGDAVETLYRFVYGANGLSLEGAALVVVGLAVWAYGAPRLSEAAAARLARQPAATRASVRRMTTAAKLLVAAIVVFGLPGLAGTYLADVIDTVGLYVLMGLGLNIVVGYAGLLDLGYVAFFAIGAYSVGFLTSTSGRVGLGFWEALPLAILLSIASGVILGIPVLKTHGDYLAIITLGFGEIMGKLAVSDFLRPWIGGAQGIRLIPPALDLPRMSLPLIGRVNPPPPAEIYYPIVVACAAATYLAWRMRHSRFGRAWTAIREDEDVAEALGVNLVNTKLLAFATGAALAGTSGAFFAAKVASVFPNSFGLLVSINVLVLIIVGGMGSTPGVFLGALVLVGLPELLREFKDFRMLLYGAVLIVMMLNRPEGLRPSRLARRELHQEPEESGARVAEPDPATTAP